MLDYERSLVGAAAALSLCRKGRSMTHIVRARVSNGLWPGAPHPRPRCYLVAHDIRALKAWRYSVLIFPRTHWAVGTAAHPSDLALTNFPHVLPVCEIRRNKDSVGVLTCNSAIFDKRSGR